MNRGVEVELVQAVRGELLENDQLFARDIGVTIGDKLVVSSMRKLQRRTEIAGLDAVRETLGEDKIVVAPPHVFLEGGDIVVDRGRIFLGIGQRSSADAVDFLRSNFPDFEVVPVKLRGLNDGVDVLHLDCAFCPVGQNHALIFPEGIDGETERIFEGYEPIHVTAEEQATLQNNVLSVSPTVVISRAGELTLNDKLRASGIEVEEVPFDHAFKLGGSFRCCSLPLRRDPQPLYYKNQE